MDEGKALELVRDGKAGTWLAEQRRALAGYGAAIVKPTKGMVKVLLGGAATGLLGGLLGVPAWQAIAVGLTAFFAGFVAWKGERDAREVLAKRVDELTAQINEDEALVQEIEQQATQLNPMQRAALVNLGLSGVASQSDWNLFTARNFLTFVYSEETVIRPTDRYRRALTVWAKRQKAVI